MLLSESVIAVEVVGPDAQPLDPWIVGQRDGQWRRLALGLPALLEQLPHSRQVGRGARQCPGHGLLQLGGAVGGQQPLKAPRLVPLCAEGLGAGLGVVQPVHPPVLAGLALVRGQRLDVIGYLNLLVPVIAAWVAGHDLGASRMRTVAGEATTVNVLRTAVWGTL